MNFETTPEIEKEDNKTEEKVETKAQWENPDGTIGYGTEEERKETLENWDNK